MSTQRRVMRVKGKMEKTLKSTVLVSLSIILILRLPLMILLIK
jgi:hypothetical protein